MYYKYSSHSILKQNKETYSTVIPVFNYFMAWVCAIRWVQYVVQCTVGIAIGFACLVGNSKIAGHTSTLFSHIEPTAYWWHHHRIAATSMYVYEELQRPRQIEDPSSEETSRSAQMSNIHHDHAHRHHDVEQFCIIIGSGSGSGIGGLCCQAIKLKKANNIHNSATTLQFWKKNPT